MSYQVLSISKFYPSKSCRRYSKIDHLMKKRLINEEYIRLHYRIFNQTVNLIGGPTQIRVRFGDAPYTRSVFFFTSLDF